MRYALTNWEIMRATVFYNIKCDYERWLCHSDFGGTALNDLKTKTSIRAVPTLRELEQYVI